MITRADHPSGSDRIFEALGRRPEGRAEPSSTCRATCRPSPPDIRAALARSTIRRWTSQRSRRNPRGRGHAPRTSSRRSVRRSAPDRLRALYFTRATAPRRGAALPPHRPYAYRRAALVRFVAFRPRRWNCAKSSSSCARSRPACASTSSIVDSVPLGVDTPEDLEPARRTAGESERLTTRPAEHDHEQSPRKSHSRASRAPTPTSPSPKPIRTPSRCPARPSRTRSPRSPRARPSSA